MSTNRQGTNFKYGIECGDKSARPQVVLVTGFLAFTPTLSPAQVAANTTAEQTFTVTGLKTTDIVTQVIKPTAQAGLGIVGWRVSAADTLAITFSNNTAAGITPTASEVYKVVVIAL